MPNTIIGPATFGIAQNANGLQTDKLTVSNKSQKKEVRDSLGDVVSVAYYGFMSDISGSGVGVSTITSIGTAITAATASAKLGSAIYLDSVSFDFSNEDFVKTSFKATSFDAI